MKNSFSEGGDTVEVCRPVLHQGQQDAVIRPVQQEGMQHHFIGRLAQGGVLNGDVGGHGGQLPHLSKHIHPALPYCCIVLHIENTDFLSVQSCSTGTEEPDVALWPLFEQYGLCFSNTAFVSAIWHDVRPEQQV